MASMRPLEFVVTLSMVAGGDRKRLGVDADWGDGKTLYIKSVIGGAIEEWNRVRPGDERMVRGGDRVVAVNGKSGDAQAMVQEIRDSTLLQLLIRRDPSALAPPGVVAAAAPTAASPAGPPGFAARGSPSMGGFSAADIIAAHRWTQAEREADLEGAAAAARAAAGHSALAGAKTSRHGGGEGRGQPPSDKQGLVDHYKVLGVKENADDTEVKKSYRQLVLRWHPDKHPDDRAEAEVKIRQINVAYETLSNPVKRSAYDQMMAAVVRRRTGAVIDTSFVKPRMSIPKDFMLCPLGYPDHFVRMVGDSLLVQSREDVPGVGFKDFFAASKFSLWWLPEVNNMCRLRAQQTAAQGVDGGVHLMFGLAKDFAQSSESEISLGACQDVRQANVIAIASPFSQGAFRFEGAFWPGRFLTYRPPGSMLMAKLAADDATDEVVDFLLVDYSASYKYMTMSEVLASAVEGQSVASQGGYVKLSDLRADLNVRMYFQQMLGSTVWNNKDFETFFEGHYDQWDFDIKKARVRLRSKQEAAKLRMGSRRAPTSEFTGLLARAEAQAEVLQVVLASKAEELEGLSVSAFVPALEKLAGDLPRDGGRHAASELRLARFRMLAALPRFCARVLREHSERDDGGAEPLPMTALLALHRAVVDIGEAAAGVAGEDAGRGDLATAVREAAEKLAALAAKRVTRSPGSVDMNRFADLLAVPLPWEAVAEPLRAELARHLRKTGKAPGSFVTAIRAAISTSMPGLVSESGCRGIVEDLARWELAGLGQHLESQTAAEALLAIAESGVLLEEVASRLRPPLLHRLPLPDLVEIVAVLAEMGVGADALRPALQTRVAVAGPGLAAVPSQRLLRLAATATKSAFVAECALGPVASAAASALHVWPLECIPELLLVVGAAEGAAASSGARRLFARAAEVVTPRLGEMQPAQLLRTVVAAGTQAAHCRELLEAAASRAVARLEDLGLDELLLLTQGALPLGSSSPVLAPLLSAWAQRLGSPAPSDGALPADDLALLAQLLALVAPYDSLAFEEIGARLLEAAGSLSSMGRGSALAAFPAEAGPVFSQKAKLREALLSAEAAANGAKPRRSRSRSRKKRRKDEDSGDEKKVGEKRKKRKSEKKRSEDAKAKEDEDYAGRVVE